MYAAEPTVGYCLRRSTYFDTKLKRVYVRDQVHKCFVTTRSQLQIICTAQLKTDCTSSRFRRSLFADIPMTVLLRDVDPAGYQLYVETVDPGPATDQFVWSSCTLENQRNEEALFSEFLNLPRSQIISEPVMANHTPKPRSTASQRPGEPRRSTRQSLSSRKHLHYDTKYHPVDEAMRPSNASKRKAAHHIVENGSSGSESTTASENAYCQDDSEDGNKENNNESTTRHADDDDIIFVSSKPLRGPLPMPRGTKSRPLRPSSTTTPIYSQNRHPQDRQLRRLELLDDENDNNDTHVKVTEKPKRRKKKKPAIAEKRARFDLFAAKYQQAWLDLEPKKSALQLLESAMELHASTYTQAWEASIEQAQDHGASACNDAEGHESMHEAARRRGVRGVAGAAVVAPEDVERARLLQHVQAASRVAAAADKRQGRSDSSIDDCGMEAQQAVEHFSHTTPPLLARRQSWPPTLSQDAALQRQEQQGLDPRRHTADPAHVPCRTTLPRDSTVPPVIVSEPHHLSRTAQHRQASTPSLGAPGIDGGAAATLLQWMIENC